MSKCAETRKLAYPSAKEKKWLLISNKNKDVAIESDFELAGVAVPRVKEVLDLGVNFNSKLNFSNHISIIITKAKQRLFLLKKISDQKIPPY